SISWSSVRVAFARPKYESVQRLQAIPRGLLSEQSVARGPFISPVSLCKVIILHGTHDCKVTLVSGPESSNCLVGEHEATPEVHSRFRPDRVLHVETISTSRQSKEDFHQSRFVGRDEAQFSMRVSDTGRAPSPITLPEDTARRHREVLAPTYRSRSHS